MHERASERARKGGAEAPCEERVDRLVVIILGPVGGDEWLGQCGSEDEAAEGERERREEAGR